MSQEYTIFKTFNFSLIEKLTYACNDIDQVLLLFAPLQFFSSPPHHCSFLISCTLRYFLKLEESPYPCGGDIDSRMGPHPDALSLSNHQLSTVPQLGAGLPDDHSTSSTMLVFLSCLILCVLTVSVNSSVQLPCCIFNSPLSNARTLP